MGGVVFDGFEKKRKAKAKAAERAMQVMSNREMKMIEGLLEAHPFEGEEVESVLNESRAADGFGGSSSWVGIGEGFMGNVSESIWEYSDFTLSGDSSNGFRELKVLGKWVVPD